MATVPIDLAATLLPELFARVEAGEEVVIANGARTGMKLVPTEAAPPVLRPRQFGTLGPISDEEAEESVRSLPKEYWGYIGEDED